MHCTKKKVPVLETACDQTALGYVRSQKAPVLEADVQAEFSHVCPSSKVIVL